MKIRISFIFAIWICFILLVSCSTYKASQYDFPEPVDTSSREIQFQDSRIFTLIEDELYAGNQFAGARLNEITLVDEKTAAVVILPENVPINPSPWFAFNLWSTEPHQIEIILTYRGFEHRYYPKISYDKVNWAKLDSSQIVSYTDSTFKFRVEVPVDTVWIAGQELWASDRVRAWADTLAEDERITIFSVGKSKLGRPLWGMEIKAPNKEANASVVLFSRQHPPEVTGFLALKSFLNQLLRPDEKNLAFFEEHTLLVFPLMNPDGVDLGHWRHNAGGIDLNRDWAYYRQPETRQIADYISKYNKKKKMDVVVGLDFHSTFEDVFYTNVDSLRPGVPTFRDDWLSTIEQNIEAYEVNEKPSGLGRPVSKTWFYTQFGAAGVTYEIGDETDREFIRLKGAISADALVRALRGDGMN